MKAGKRPLKLVFMACLCLLLLVPVVPKVKVIMDLSQRKASLQKEQARLQITHQQLEKKLKEAQAPANIEKIAREKLHMVRDGETVMVEVKP